MTTTADILSSDDGTSRLQSILEDLSAQRTTTATRKAAARKVIEEFDLDRLLDLQAKMGRMIDILTANTVSDGDDPIISSDKAERLMAEFLDSRDIVELLDVRKGMVREAVFAHITAILLAQGDQDAEHNNGALEVPRLGKKFAREGGARGKSTIDGDKLRALLGDRANEVFDAEVVPAQVIEEHVSFTLNPDKLVALIQADPEVMETVREAVTPGGYRTPRFVVRDI